MPQVEFEPTIPVFERAKTLDDLDRATTGIAQQSDDSTKLTFLRFFFCNFKL
jgi:hypothetical protein